MHRKKLTKLFYLMFLSMCLFITACSNSDEPVPQPQPQPNEPVINYYDVIFVVDNVEVSKQRVEEGKCATAPTAPAKEDYKFVGWYFNDTKFDLTKPIYDNYILDAKYEEDGKYIEIFVDTSFKDGFNLINPSTTNPVVVKHLTTDNLEGEPKWKMAQWWTKYDLKDADYKYIGGEHVYQNETHVIKINTAKNSLYTKLITSLEYDSPRVGGQNWPHLLIEQSIDRHRIVQFKKVIVSLDFNIIQCINMMKPSEYDQSLHAAQFLWYFTLQNIVPKDSNPEEVGNNGDYFWFGVPLFDSRHPNGITSYKHVDQGFVGATNKLIYGMDNRSYIDHPFEYNKNYHIELDILPYLKDAYLYGKTNGALLNCLWENMCIGYMNLGWEIPGTFDVESVVSNISVKAYYA